jgi:hypothetical protein
MSAFLGFDWSGLVVAGAFLLMILGTAWGYYTRTGSDIDEHPIDDRTQSPGAKAPATVSGAGRTPESPTGPKAARGRFSGHGTR